MLVRVLLACMRAVSALNAQSSDDQAVEYARQLVSGQKPVVPAAGYVPDSNTAIAIATAVLTPIYGKNTIDSEKPWKAGLKGGVWTVTGTFNGKGKGGEAIVQIDKKAGTIVFVTHTM